MPANLPPDYYKKEKELQMEKDPMRKIEIINEMLAIMPKHKGTDKLQALLRAKIAKLKKELKRTKKIGTRRYEYAIPKEGAGQVVLVGSPNAGKSSILKALTNADPKIGSYPFTTVKPEIGMIEFEDVRIQLIDLPPVSEETPGWIFGIIRNADLIILVIDLSTEDPMESLQELLDLLDHRNLKPDGERPGLVIASKCDLVSEKLFEFSDLPVIRFPKGSEAFLKEKIFNLLGIIRVYTKKPRQKFTKSEPMIMKRGATVIDAAKHLKREFVQNLRYARIWRGVKKGRRVERTFPLEDKDIIELHF
ncbi:MAG TPA: TGS domain-containing protein [bacterium (Candidatus Stahlbacteria)]|nr:TGS domain-containing protein [Candidatus Stahlbacteria bacterium]